MLTRTKLAIAVALLASSASGALAQTRTGNGVPAELMRPVMSYYALPRHAVAPPRHFSSQAYGNELPAAPYGGR